MLDVCLSLFIYIVGETPAYLSSGAATEYRRNTQKHRHTRTQLSSLLTAVCVGGVAARTHLAPTWSDSRLTRFQPNRPAGALSLSISPARVRRKRKTAGQPSVVWTYTRSGGKRSDCHAATVRRRRRRRENTTLLFALKAAAAASIAGWSRHSCFINSSHRQHTQSSTVRLLYIIILNRKSQAKQQPTSREGE